MQEYNGVELEVGQVWVDSSGCRFVLTTLDHHPFDGRAVLVVEEYHNNPLCRPQPHQTWSIGSSPDDLLGAMGDRGTNSPLFSLASEASKAEDSDEGGSEAQQPASDPGRMTKTEYNDFIRAACNDVLRVMEAKNADYAEGADFFSNFRVAELYGVDPLKGLFVRMGDKMSRIQSWCRRGDLKVEGEGLEDCLMDNIGYSLLALAFLEELGRTKQ